MNQKPDWFISVGLNDQADTAWVHFLRGFRVRAWRTTLRKLRAAAPVWNLLRTSFWIVPSSKWKVWRTRPSAIKLMKHEEEAMKAKFWARLLWTWTCWRPPGLRLSDFAQNPSVRTPTDSDFLILLRTIMGPLPWSGPDLLCALCSSQPFPLLSPAFPLPSPYIHYGCRLISLTPSLKHSLAIDPILQRFPTYQLQCGQSSLYSEPR